MYFILKYELKHLFHSSVVIIHPFLIIRPDGFAFWFFELAKSCAFWEYGMTQGNNSNLNVFSEIQEWKILNSNLLLK